MALFIANRDPRKQLSKKAIRNALKVTEVVHDKLISYTCSLWDFELRSDSPVLLDDGLYPIESEDRACYVTPQAAMKACIVGIICMIPYKKGLTANGVPTWVLSFLPLRPQHDMFRNYCVMYEHKQAGAGCREEAILFATLTFQGGKHVLSVSRGGAHDFQDITFSDVEEKMRQNM